MNTIKVDRKTTKMVAHRGLSGIELENTCAAFVAAGNRDYFGIETDVHRTADGKLVVIHDDRTGRVAAVDLPVEGSCFSDLRAITLTDKDGQPRADLRIPTLEEYLKICSRYEKVAVLELKNAFTQQEIGEILRQVQEFYSLEGLIFISFFYENLVKLRQLCPEAAVQFLTSKDLTMELVEKLEADSIDLDIYYERLGEQEIALLHDHGITVNCWTVDSAEAAEDLIRWGVDQITTNILQ